MTTTSLNSFLYVEAVNFFRGLLKESIETCSSNKMDVTEYKTISLDEYYEGYGWDRTAGDDGNDVEGIDIISDFIVLNDDTRAALEHAFEEARDEEIEAFFNECYYYTGQPNVLYADEDDAIEASETDFRNDVAANDESRYFDEDYNETEDFKEDFKKYASEKIMLFSDAGNVSVADIQEIR